MSKIQKTTYPFFRGRNFTMNLVSRVRKVSGESDYFITDRNGYINLFYSPMRAITISIGNGEDYNVIQFPIEEFYSVGEAFERVYKALHAPNMYYIDGLNELILNKDLVKESSVVITSYDQLMVIKPSIVRVDQIAHEGIDIILNGKISAPVEHKELKKLVKNMKRTDIHNLMASVSLMTHVIGQDSYIPNRRDWK